MGLFSGNSSLERAIEVATDGNKISEDWQEIMEIVDQVEIQPNGAKDALRAIMKRVKHKDPHVAMLGLVVLDACVVNAKRKFHLEVSSRYFDEEVRGMLQNSNNYTHDVIAKLCQLIKKWSENEFRSDPALSLIPSLLHHIRTFKPQYLVEPVTAKSTPHSAPAASADQLAKKREEEELAKAIALSLEEEKRKSRSSSSTQQNNLSSANNTGGSALYPIMSNAASNSTAIYATVEKKPKEPRKVRAMYDFEAAEDNELTFKAGEIIHVLDDSDPNWWKGSNHRGEGLFPTNFVTSDLNYEPENEFTSAKKDKSSDKEDPSSANSAAGPVVEHKPVTIDESLIDKTLNMIHDADPTGERADPEELLTLEDQCTRMWPLIDTELQKVDRLQSSLEELNVQLNDALAMYDQLMKEQASQMASGALERTYPPGMMPGEFSNTQNQFYKPAPGQMPAAGGSSGFGMNPREQMDAGYNSAPYLPPGMYQQQQQQPPYNMPQVDPAKMAALSLQNPPQRYLPTGQPGQPAFQNLPPGQSFMYQQQ